MEVSDFGWALKWLRDGKKVCRKGWNGKDMWLALQVPDASSKMQKPYIYISTTQGQLVPWVASNGDLLETDWALVGPSF